MNSNLNPDILQFRIIDKEASSGISARARITQLIGYLRNPKFNKGLKSAKSTQQLEYFTKYITELSNLLIPDQWLNDEGYVEHRKCVVKLKRVTHYKLRHFKENLLIMITDYLGFSIKEGKEHVFDQLASRCVPYRSLHHDGNYNLKEIRKSIYDKFEECLEHPNCSYNKLHMCVGIYSELAYLTEHDLMGPFKTPTELLKNILDIAYKFKRDRSSKVVNINNSIKDNHRGDFHKVESNPVEDYFQLPPDELMTDEQYEKIDIDLFNTSSSSNTAQENSD